MRRRCQLWAEVKAAGRDRRWTAGGWLAFLLVKIKRILAAERKLEYAAANLRAEDRTHIAAVNFNGAFVAMKVDELSRPGFRAAMRCDGSVDEGIAHVRRV